jgi:hypothetical protein
MSVENIGAPAVSSSRMICSRMDARQVLAALGVAHLEGLAGQHHGLDVGQRDVGTGLGVVETAIGVLLEHAHGGRGLGFGRCGAAAASRHGGLLGFGRF